MIKVFQIALTDVEVNLINTKGWEATPRTQAAGKYYDQRTEEDFALYNHVANVETNDMEEAFMLMNLWEQPERITKIGQCHSLSVGDFLEMADGSRFLCASFGFNPIKGN